MPASTTQEFHVKYKYTVYEQTHKCLVKVFYLCIDILPDVNLNVLIVMQNLCEYSISCKNSKYEFFYKDFEFMMILPCAKFHGFDLRFFIIHIT